MKERKLKLSLKKLITFCQHVAYILPYHTNESKISNKQKKSFILGENSIFIVYHKIIIMPEQCTHAAINLWLCRGRVNGVHTVTSLYINHYPCTLYYLNYLYNSTDTITFLWSIYQGKKSLIMFIQKSLKKNWDINQTQSETRVCTLQRGGTYR